jgi:hypothetical protein
MTAVGSSIVAEPALALAFAQIIGSMALLSVLVDVVLPATEDGEAPKPAGEDDTGVRHSWSVPQLYVALDAAVERGAYDEAAAIKKRIDTAFSGEGLSGTAPADHAPEGHVARHADDAPTHSHSSRRGRGHANAPSAARPGSRSGRGVGRGVGHGGSRGAPVRRKVVDHTRGHTRPPSARSGPVFRVDGRVYDAPLRPPRERARPDSRISTWPAHGAAAAHEAAAAEHEAVSGVETPAAVRARSRRRRSKADDGAGVRGHGADEDVTSAHVRPAHVEPALPAELVSWGMTEELWEQTRNKKGLLDLVASGQEERAKARIQRLRQIVAEERAD